MKLEVGMYVRTKDGFIDEVMIEYQGYYNNPNCKCKHINCKYNYYDEQNIVKASHNIIDLIEVGDYVNGKEIKEISVRDNKPIVKFASIPGCYYMNDEIDTIVTKEQFESMSYKVGE